WSLTCYVLWVLKWTAATKSKPETAPKLNNEWPQLEPPQKHQEAAVTIDAILLLIMGVLFAAAIYLLMDRTLTRIMFGLMMFTNAANLLIIIMAGPAG